MVSKRIRSILFRSENTLASLFLFLIALLPILEIIARRFFQTGIHSSTYYVHHLVLWITFLGGMITSREGEHLSLSAGVGLLPEQAKQWVTSLTACISVAVTATLAVSALTFLREGFDSTRTIGLFPIKWVIVIMPVGFAVMALRFILGAPKIWPGKIIALSGIPLAWLISLTPFEYTGYVFWVCFVILIVSALAGTPIFIVLGGIASVLFFNAGGALAVIPNEAYTMLTGDIIPTIPLFTLAGFILSESKAGERLVTFFQATFGWLPGGLAIMATIVCAFFTTFTGASGVTILALGGLLSFILVKSKYPKNCTTGLLTASGSIGLLFPPSLPIILYGVVAHINIKKMFVGGILPGTLMVIAVAVIGIHYAKKHRVERIPFHFKDALSAFLKAFWEISLPFVILFCFFGGVTTIVESGAIAVLYALLIEVVIHRDIKYKDICSVFLKGIPIIGGVLVILAVANGLSYFIVDAEVPMTLAAWCSEHIHSKYVFLILLNIALLITGCLMDIFSAIMVVVPLIIPLGEAYGIHPVHLGIIFLANLELGYLTPPVGINLFLSSFRFNEPLVRIYRYVIPFLIMMAVSVLLITYIPWMSTALLSVFHF